MKILAEKRGKHWLLLRLAFNVTAVNLVPGIRIYLSPRKQDQCLGTIITNEREFFYLRMLHSALKQGCPFQMAFLFSISLQVQPAALL